MLRRTPIKEKESDVQKAILDYLSARRIFHYRNNSGAFIFPATDKHARRFIKVGAVGSPDIVAVIQGIYIGIECKATNGKQSESQKDFQKRLEQAGGYYILAHSLDELAKGLNVLTSDNESNG